MITARGWRTAWQRERLPVPLALLVIAGLAAACWALVAAIVIAVKAALL